VAARYDAIAEFYDAAVADDLTDVGTAALLELAGDVAGLRIADVACGQGRVSRELARRGASVVGVDISERLLAKARAAEERHPLGIEYVRADAAANAEFASPPFDGVVCNYGLSDIDDLDGVLAAVTAAVEPGGWFVFSILHPCFPGWDADAPSSWPPGEGYFREGWWQAQNPGFRGKVGANHRTLATYLNLLKHHGLLLDVVAEPRPDPTWAARKPGAEPVPVYLVIRCVARG
jgi:2-polyprenyl-3-methyl-5-hydroxy-6-metoxy-1,4-benzoquinol methylase